MVLLTQPPKPGMIGCRILRKMIYIIILKIVCKLENMSKLTEKLERLEDDLADYQVYVVKFIKY